MSENLIGIDIGGTKLAVVLAKRTGEVLRKRRAPTRAELGPESVLQTLFALVQELMQGVQWRDIAAFGVSCGGPLDSDSGVIYSPPNLPGWDAIPLKQRVEEAFGRPAWVENDANAGALAEWKFGAGRGLKNVIYMTMGTGIGGGLVLDGQLYRGTNDLAGELGHQTLLVDGPECGCGKRGCLESLCSGPAIARRAGAALEGGHRSSLEDDVSGDPSRITAEAVFSAARRGDRLCREIVDETGEYLGWGIGNVLNIINPELVAIGTIAVHGWDLLEPPTRASLRRHAWPRALEAAQVLPSQLGDSIGDLAAIAIALAHLR
jgi:glucokinase